MIRRDNLKAKRKGNIMKINKSVSVNEKAQRKMEKINLAKAKKEEKATRKYAKKMNGISYLRELKKAIKEILGERGSWELVVYGVMAGLAAGMMIPLATDMEGTGALVSVLGGAILGGIGVFVVPAAIEATEEYNRDMHWAENKYKQKLEDAQMNMDNSVATEGNSNEKK